MLQWETNCFGEFFFTSNTRRAGKIRCDKIRDDYINQCVLYIMGEIALTEWFLLSLVHAVGEGRLQDLKSCSRIRSFMCFSTSSPRHSVRHLVEVLGVRSQWCKDASICGIMAWNDKLIIVIYSSDLIYKCLCKVSLRIWHFNRLWHSLPPSLSLTHMLSHMLNRCGWAELLCQGLQ